MYLKMSEIIGFKCDDSIIDLQSAQNPATFNANTQEQKASQNNANNTKINEKIGEPIYFDNSKEALEIIRHSAAHLMAQAIKTLYPDAKFFVGPVVDEGFYYDFKTSAKIGEEDLITIEKKMKEIAKIG